MLRQTGTYRTTTTHGETVKAFVPHPLPPADPPLMIEGDLAERHAAAVAAMNLLRVAGAMVPDPGWFLYGFVRKEAVLSSQIEGTQATLRDVATFEAISSTDRPADVEEVCNYVVGLNHARATIADPVGLPLSTRLLCDVHRLLMRGVRGEDKLPGEIRHSQNWIGGSRPGNARFVPPPHEEVAPALAALEKWMHSDDPLPPLIKAGLAHVQFETIHPFLDGNGRIGRMLITLLVEHWGLLDQPLLYLSVAFKRRQGEYYARLAAVRAEGDWEGWTAFFLACVKDAADDGVRIAEALHTLMGRDRARVVRHERATMTVVQLLDLLPSNPVLTVPRASELLGITAPPARKAIDLLEELGVLRETTGKQRDRVYAYHAYLELLTES
ncbi:MAG: Fic family protein [Phycisphaeraceae bacterium]|nr:Fic family protein [Phycisphaeraceae bacterium]MCW5762904.1 Fic family protein [Phycisphaeraceae bacterium]